MLSVLGRCKIEVFWQKKTIPILKTIILNSIGNTFRLTTFGESHGPAVGGVLDGCPAGKVLDFAIIQQELLRRRDGDVPSPLTTARHEADQIEWLSGLYQGRTLGTPIAFFVRNQDCRPADYGQLQDCYRPGHADYTYQQKYGHRDPRGGGRASGRETVARVIAGAIAKQLLLTQGISFSTTIRGRQIACTILGLPAGVGDPVFDRLNARLGFAMLSIPSAMAFAVGDPDDSYQLSPDQFPDAWQPQGTADRLTLTNHCGGIQGGISNGMPVIFHVGFHAPVTHPEGMTCRRADGSLVSVAPHGRHDRDHITRLPVIVEAMAALTVADLIALT